MTLLSEEAESLREKVGLLESSRDEAETERASAEAEVAKLREESEHLARIAELRFFAGLSKEDVGKTLGMSRTTVGRRWRVARALLASYLEREL